MSLPQKLNLFVLLLLLSPLSLIAQVERGPYLQSGGTTHMTIRWRTDAVTDAQVWYGSSPTNLTQTVSQSTLGTDHEIKLTGLSVNTQYYYGIGDASGMFAGGDADHFFFTHPQAGYTGKIKMWVLGDSGTKNKNARDVRDAYYGFMGPDYTDLILMLGDNAYATGTDEEYQDAIFNNMYEDIIVQTPIWPTPGNHDTKDYGGDGSSAPYFDIFTLPTAGESGGLASGTEHYYSMDYGDLHIISLNTQNQGTGSGSPMMVWLENDLAATTQKWIITIFHHPPYSKGSHDSDAENKLIKSREDIVPVLENYGVDLVMAGHSHAYERSFLINGHYDESNTLNSSMILDNGDGREFSDGSYKKEITGPDAGKGAVYVVAGSAGKISNAPLGHPVHYYDAVELGSVLVEIENNRLDLKFIDATGNVDDYFTLLKESVNGLPPSVSISSPTSGQTFTTLQPLAIAADANDPDGNITQVEFFVDGVSIGTDTSDPFTTSWIPSLNGTYAITAKATDNDGNVTVASAVSVIFSAPGGGANYSTSFQISSNSDDAEEVNSSGSVAVNSSDFDIINDGGTKDQTVGLRFAGLNIPKGAAITNAYIQFTSDEVRTDPASFVVHGEAVDDAVTFTNSSNNITSRPLTSASTSWSPAGWQNVGDASIAQQTSDLSLVLQEIIDRPGYADGNAVAFIISGNGRRAAETHNSNPALAAELFVDYSVGGGGSSNAPPTVNITSPADGTTYTSYQMISIDASASDSDGSISQVEFFVDGISVGIDNSAPYSQNWNPSGNGNYVLSTTATDDQGATSSSSVSISFNVPNTPPNVFMTSPLGGATYTSFQSISIGANANDSGGSISQVEFFVDGISVGIDNSAPYSQNWPPSANGTYSLSATATDDEGATASSSVNITVNVAASNTPPTVGITSPSNGATYTNFQIITIHAIASDSDGSVSQVEFFVDGVSVGIDNTTSYARSWTPSANGTYVLSATATDNDGATSSSTLSIIVNVPPTNSPPTVSITDPVNGASFTGLSAISIAASANDSDGNISQVEFLVNGASILTFR